MNSDVPKQEMSALRDRNLAKTAPLAFCLYVFLQELHWQGSNTELVKLVGDNPEELTLVDLRNNLLELGYNTRQSKLTNLKRLNWCSEVARSSISRTKTMCKIFMNRKY